MNARCKTCQAPVVWGTLPSGKRMPVDPEPVAGGNVVVVSGNDGPELQVLNRDQVQKRRNLGLRARTSHFATCPQAKAHRR